MGQHPSLRRERSLVLTAAARIAVGREDEGAHQQHLGVTIHSTATSRVPPAVVMRQATQKSAGTLGSRIIPQSITHMSPAPPLITMAENPSLPPRHAPVGVRTFSAPLVTSSTSPSSPAISIARGASVSPYVLV